MNLCGQHTSLEGPMSATRLSCPAISGYWPNMPPPRGLQQLALALLSGRLAQPSDTGTGQAEFSPGSPFAFAWHTRLALRPLGSAIRHGHSAGQVSAAQARHSPSLGLVLITPAMAWLRSLAPPLSLHITSPSSAAHASLSRSWLPSNCVSIV